MSTQYIVGELCLNVGNVNYADGAVRVTPRGGRQGDMIMSQLHGCYHQAVLDGRVFSCSNQGLVSTTAALATTWTGLGIANPSTSQKNLSLIAVHVAQGAAGAAACVGVMGSATTTGFTAASIGIVNRKIGSSEGSVAYSSATATIGTPVLWNVFGSVGSLATTGYGAMPGLMCEFDGRFVIPPGSCILSYTTAATTSATIWTFVWEEVPI